VNLERESLAELWFALEDRVVFVGALLVLFFILTGGIS